MKAIITFLILIVGCSLAAQTIATLEDVSLALDSFLNGKNANGQFQSANVIFPNDYNVRFDAWSGWAMSSKKDSTTSGFRNQYSAKAAGGFNNSNNYAVAFGEENVLRFNGRVKLGGFYITNNTYAYNTMRDGDQFSKRFGGETSNDPDFLRLAVYKFLNGLRSADSVVFYLADYRFVNNSQDFIIKNWTFVNLSALGEADSLFFRMASSDVGEFGINTPTYFCLDNLTTTPIITDVKDITTSLQVNIFPNPTTDWSQIECQDKAQGIITVFDLQGKVIESQVINNGKSNLNLSFLPKGIYLLKIARDNQSFTQKIVKQ